jgi:Zn finger protein HypA/HybF involved in hydrogenase expression
MLQKTNETIAYYLKCASFAHERATIAMHAEMRELHEKMYTRCMDLAAKTARFEQADLFLQCNSFKKLPPSDLCRSCFRRMRLLTVEVTSEGEKHTFECSICGSQRVREMQSHWLSQFELEITKLGKHLLNQRDLRSCHMHSDPNTSPVIKCAQCGEPLAAPEWSEHIDDYRVRHLWKCEPCNYSFEAIIASTPLKARQPVSVHPSKKAQPDLPVTPPRN